MAFLLQLICTRLRASSAPLPVRCSAAESTSIRCESVPPETMSTLRDLSVCQPIWRYQACLPPSCSASRAHREIDQRNSKLFTEERFARYFPAQTITFPKRPKLAYE